jgi:hypothetical protein
VAELAISAFAAMGTATAGAAATAGTTAAATAATAGTAAATAGTLASTLGTLQTVMTVGGAVASLVGAFAGNQDVQTQAQFVRLDAEGDRLSAEEKATRIRREYVQRVGATRVAFAGSGVDISGADAIEESLGQQANDEIGFVRSSARYNSAGAAIRASNIESQGRSKLVSAAFKSGGQLLDTGISIANRG